MAINPYASHNGAACMRHDNCVLRTLPLTIKTSSDVPETIARKQAEESSELGTEDAQESFPHRSPCRGESFSLRRARNRDSCCSPGSLISSKHVLATRTIASCGLSLHRVLAAAQRRKSRLNYTSCLQSMSVKTLYMGLVEVYREKSDSQTGLKKSTIACGLYEYCGQQRPSSRNLGFTRAGRRKNSFCRT